MDVINSLFNSLRRISKIICILSLTLLAACVIQPFSTTVTPMQGSPQPAASPIAQRTLVSCTLPTIVAPTLPAVTPGYTEKDPATGLHVTGQAQVIDLATYRLSVVGKVDYPLELTYDDLRCLPKITSQPNLICPGFFEDVATWAGASFVYVLDLAGVQPGAEMVHLTSADGYTVDLPLDNARASESMLAYEWNGQPLPVLHGFPVRAVFPGMAGGKWIKWLIKIEVS